MITRRTATVLGVACLVGSGFSLSSPAAQAQTPQPLLAQVRVEVFVLPASSSNYQNNFRVKRRDKWGKRHPSGYFYDRDSYPKYRYRKESYCSVHNCYDRRPTYFIQRDYWGNPVFSNRQDVTPGGLKGRTFNYHGW